MQGLEFFYDNFHPANDTLPRKFDLPDNKRVLIWGPKYCGKRSLTERAAKERFDTKAVLFVDCEDFRFDHNQLSHLNSFIEQKKIELLILYGDCMEFEAECEYIWRVSHRFLNMEGFTSFKVSNLDFEEYLLFAKRSEPKIAFNSFLKSGNIPEMARVPEIKRDRRAKEIIKLTFGTDIPIIKEITLHQGQSRSVHFIFTRLKERIKISKDRFYGIFEDLCRSEYIYAVEKFNSKRSPKKLFFYDFLLKTYLHVNREFPKIFENMVFLEIKEPLFYLEPLGFYLPKSEKILMAVPFGNEVRIENKIEQVLKKSGLKPKKIEVVTVATSFKYDKNGIECEVVPFYEWALGK